MASYFNRRFEENCALPKERDAYFESSVFLGAKALSQAEECEFTDCQIQGQESFIGAKSLYFGSSFLVGSANGSFRNAQDIKCEHGELNASSLFGEAEGIHIHDCALPRCDSSFLKARNVDIADSEIGEGKELFRESEGISINHSEVKGNGLFDSARKVVIKESLVYGDGGFKNCHDVEIHNSYIAGDNLFLGGENITLNHCQIKCDSSFHDVKTLCLIDCRIDGGEGLFTGCENIDAEIHSDLQSIVNPKSGKIECGKVAELICDSLEVEVIVHEE